MIHFLRGWLVVLSWAALAAHALPAPLPAPDLSAHDFRSDGAPVAVGEVSVIGLAPSGNAYVAGAFTTVDGQPRPGVARFKLDGSLDAAWPPAPLQLPAPSQLAVESAAGDVALVTRATTASDQTLVRVSAAGTAVTLIAASTRLVEALAFDATGALYAALGRRGSGFFDANLAAEVRKFLADGTPDGAFSAVFDGSFDQCFITGPHASHIRVLRVIDGFLYVGGDFLRVTGSAGGANIGGVARVALETGNVDSSWAPFSASVGAAQTAPAQPKATCFPTPNGIVQAILPGPNDSVYLAGRFDITPQRFLARVPRAAPGAIDPTWLPQVPAPLAAEIDPSGAFVYIGGSFVVGDSFPRNALAAISTADGHVDADWDPPADGAVLLLAVAGDRLLAGGTFTQVAGAARPRLAAIPLAGRSAAGPRIAVSAPVELGAIPVGESRTARITITNTGSAAATNVAFVDGPAFGAFATDYERSNDCGTTLAPGASCALTVVAHPVQGTEGVVRTQVAVDGASPAQTRVHWTASAASLVLSPQVNSVQLARLTPVGATGSTTATISNAGMQPLRIAALSMASGGEVFSASHNCPVALAPGSSCSLTVGFRPQAAGVQNGELAIELATAATTPFSPTTLSSRIQFALRGTAVVDDDDLDDDGIPNAVEAAVGTDPLLKDNDVFNVADLFARQQYRDFLGREGEAGGIAFWASQVASGAATRARVVDTFFSSPEFQGSAAPVARLYFAYFLRVPDYDGLTFWIGRFRAGDPLDAISAQFAQSAEFSNLYGALGDTQFVDLVYRNVLGRGPDEAGLAFWAGELASGARTRGQVMTAFSESPEYRRLIDSKVYVTMIYAGMLRRAPDLPGFDFWVARRDANPSNLDLISSFFTSQEYRLRFVRF